MLSADEIMQLIQSLIWLLAGVGVFIVGMNFMGDALEKSAGSGMKRLLEKISNNRFMGIHIWLHCKGHIANIWSLAFPCANMCQTEKVARIGR